MPDAEEAYFQWLRDLDCSQLKLYAVQDGTLVFPRQPLLRLEGPFALIQLLETSVLNLINFASLVCTNGSRMRLAAGKTKCVEFGLRRA